MGETQIPPETVERATRRLKAFLATFSDEERTALDAGLAAASSASPMAVWPATYSAPPGTPAVTISALPTCSACHEAEDFLRFRGVEVVVRDVTADREAARELIAARRKTSDAVGVFPLIVVGEHVIAGFSPLKLRDALLPAGVGRPED